MNSPPLSPRTLLLLQQALEEDIGAGDWTTQGVVPPGHRSRAVILAREPGVLAGLQLAELVFRWLDPAMEFHPLKGEGETFQEGETLIQLFGASQALLSGERVALNFLQRLSGVATLTHSYVQAVRGTRARILDTRKTTPGWRELEKAAVRAGGGRNHRHGLYDMILIKGNHVAVAGGVGKAIRRALHRNPLGLPVEVEVRTLEELRTVLRQAPHLFRIMLDNMELPLLRRAIELIHAHRGRRRRPEVEVSGRVTLDRVREIAELGVECISVGALTHSARAIDLSLTWETS